MGAMKTALTFLLIVASLFALFSGKAFATDPAAYGLLLKARGEGPPQPALLLETDVEIRVTGHVARAKVTQRFRIRMRTGTRASTSSRCPRTPPSTGCA